MPQPISNVPLSISCYDERHKGSGANTVSMFVCRHLGMLRGLDRPPRSAPNRKSARRFPRTATFQPFYCRGRWRRRPILNLEFGE